MNNILDVPNVDAVISTLRANQVVFAALFGSRAKGTANPNSDYDFIVEFNPNARVGLFKFIDAKKGLERAIRRPVDLVTTKGLSRHMENEVLATMKILYDDRGKR